MTLGELGTSLSKNGETEEVREVYERCFEKTLGNNHPFKFHTVVNIANCHWKGFGDHGKGGELHQMAFEGYEAQFGKDHDLTKLCARRLIKIRATEK